jgi:hypothetical protein
VTILAEQRTYIAGRWIKALVITMPFRLEKVS